MLGFLAHAIRVPPALLFGPRWPGVAPSERFACLSHFAGGLAAIVGSSLLVVLAATWQLRLVSLVYGLGALSMLFASALYHAQKQADDGTGVWRRIDHAAVFVMIAGTYTPISYVYLSGGWFWALIGAQWAVAISGIIFKVVVVDSHRWLTASIYVGMGWMAAIPMPQLFEAMPTWGFIGLVAGGVTYTVGAVVYGLKRPDPWPATVGFHGIFHILVLLGAGLHYAVIYSCVV